MIFLAVVVGAGVPLSLFLAPGPGNHQDESPAPGAAPGEVAEVLSGLEELRKENQELRGRLAVLELRPTPQTGAPVGDFVSQEDFEAFRKEVRDSLAEQVPILPPPADLKAEVAGALQTVRKEESIERTRKAQKIRAAKLDQRIAGLTRRLGLDINQEEGGTDGLDPVRQG